MISASARRSRGTGPGPGCQRRQRGRLASLWEEPTERLTPTGALGHPGRLWHSKACPEHAGSTQRAKAYLLARAILNSAVEDGRIRANLCQVKGAGQESTAERPIVMPDVVEKFAGAMRLDALLLAAGVARD